MTSAVARSGGERKSHASRKLQDTQQRPAQPKEAPKAETRKTTRDRERQRQTTSSHRAGVHGTVLAYNQAYNFVV